MKRINVLCLTLLATLGVSVMSATGASAHEWRLNSVGIVSPTAVSSTATLRFELRNVDIEGECTMVRTGTVTKGGLGEITSITGSAGEKSVECKVTNKSEVCGKMHMEAKGLPWGTELVTNSEGKLENHLKGSPEWKVSCSEYGTNGCLAQSTLEQNISGGVNQLYQELGLEKLPGCSEVKGLETRGSEVLKAKAGTLEAK